MPKPYLEIYPTPKGPLASLIIDPHELNQILTTLATTTTTPPNTILTYAKQQQIPLLTRTPQTQQIFHQYNIHTNYLVITARGKYQHHYLEETENTEYTLNTTDTPPNTAIGDTDDDIPTAELAE